MGLIETLISKDIIMNTCEKFKKIIEKKRNNEEIEINEIAILFDDLNVIQDAFIGAIAMKDFDKMELMLHEMKEIKSIAEKYLRTYSRFLYNCAAEYVITYDIFEKLSKIRE